MPHIQMIPRFLLDRTKTREEKRNLLTRTHLQLVEFVQQTTRAHSHWKDRFPALPAKKTNSTEVRSTTNSNSQKHETKKREIDSPVRSEIRRCNSSINQDEVLGNDLCKILAAGLSHGTYRDGIAGGALVVDAASEGERGEHREHPRRGGDGLRHLLLLLRRRR